MKCPLNGMRECDFDCALMMVFDNERQVGCALAVIAAGENVKQPVDLVNAFVKNGSDATAGERG